MCRSARIVVERRARSRALRALRILLRLTLDDVRIAQIAQQAEIEYAGVNCGIMDQMASSLPTPSTCCFSTRGRFERSCCRCPPDREMLVVDSGIPGHSPAASYNERRAECEEAARRLGLHTLRDAENVAIDDLPEPLQRRART